MKTHRGPLPTEGVTLHIFFVGDLDLRLKHPRLDLYKTH